MPPSRTRRPKHGFWTFLLVLGVLAVVASGGAYFYLRRSDAVGGTPSPSTGSTTGATASPTGTGEPTTPPTTPAADLTFAATGPGTFVYADGQSAVFGTAGTLKRYRVAIETGTPVPVDQFASAVDTVLSDPRSWIAGKNVRLQRVAGNSAASNFTVFLVTPGTAEKICGAGGFDIVWRGEPYTSCRVGAKVVINIARYLRGIPDYGASLEVYQDYAINHEVGHALGHGHELCPGKGKPAPVMQQQTFSLQGCVAYGWPFLDGKRYAGPPGRIVPPN